jgi:anaerobic magnesium-protoporphyrin IX monomethyl ester cyclase
VKIALINPNWHFEGSIYFGCRAPHLPIEFGASRQLLERAGHEVLLIDAHLFALSHSDIVAELQTFMPAMVVITTAPTYLFWRCAPPELRVAQELAFAVRDLSPLLVGVGPHGSTTPRTALNKLGVDVIVMGECEDTLARLAAGAPRENVTGICFRERDQIRAVGLPQAASFVDLEPLAWPDSMIARHDHHHHRFDTEPTGPGAEVEASRGCPYSCTFCAKEHFRNSYRRRPADVVLAEIARLQRQGVTYIYFIDEIFLPNPTLLAGLIGRGLTFGVQTRIDLWKPDMIEMLGRAGCVSLEAGVESLSAEGRDALAKRCKLTTEQLAERLITARLYIPFVQANLIAVEHDDAEGVARWREQMGRANIWANDPVPLFPYPGSPDYRKLWGLPDDWAWERAHAYYLGQFDRFSNIQDDRPRRLHELELEVPR